MQFPFDGSAASGPLIKEDDHDHVKSLRGTQFRIWATRTLREHLVSGFTMNERRLAERGLDEAKQTVGLKQCCASSIQENPRRKWPGVWSEDQRSPSTGQYELDSYCQ